MINRHILMSSNAVARPAGCDALYLHRRALRMRLHRYWDVLQQRQLNFRVGERPGSHPHGKGSHHT